MKRLSKVEETLFSRTYRLVQTDENDILVSPESLKRSAERIKRDRAPFQVSDAVPLRKDAYLIQKGRNNYPAMAFVEFDEETGEISRIDICAPSRMSLDGIVRELGLPYELPAVKIDAAEPVRQSAY